MINKVLSQVVLLMVKSHVDLQRVYNDVAKIGPRDSRLMFV